MTARPWCGEFARDLFTATTFQVTAEMTDVVHATCVNGRGTVAGLHMEELPAETGFAWLDAPLHLTPRGAGEGDGRAIGIDAVTWAVCTYALPEGSAPAAARSAGFSPRAGPGCARKKEDHGEQQGVHDKEGDGRRGAGHRHRYRP